MALKSTFQRQLLLGSMIFLLLFTLFAQAAPQGPNSIERGPSERRTEATTGPSQEASAGNITPIQVNADGVTKRWQGYYGNVTGGILLADAGGNQLYQWGLANPSGEVYAANGSNVNWLKIDCVNFSTNTSVLKYNLSDLNQFIGLHSDPEQGAEDTFNATFNQTFGDDGSSFQIGSRTITNADNCSMVTLNTDTGYQNTRFKEVVLTDNESIVFASILENSQTGFNSIPLDFEMIVGVNGTTLGTVRNYFFYVELS